MPAARHIILAALLCVAARGQNLVPNSSFENGTVAPFAWSLSGSGAWTNAGYTGTGSLWLASTGCGNSWSTTNCPLTASRTYWLTFRAKAGSPYCKTAGEVRIDAGSYKRAVRPEDYWREYGFAVTTPSNLRFPVLRLDQCNVQGGLLIDDVEIRPAIPAPLLINGRLVGQDEKITLGHYSYISNLDSPAAGYARGIVEHTAYFDSWRWSFKSNEFITYCHALDGATLTNANFVAVPYWADKAKLAAEVSVDGQNWTQLAVISSQAETYGVPTLSGSVPRELLPCTNLFVRLRCLAGTILIKSYEFHADVPEMQNPATGKTSFFQLEQTNIDVIPFAMVEGPQGWSAMFQLCNPDVHERRIEFDVRTESPLSVRTNRTQSVIPASSTNTLELDLVSSASGENRARIRALDVDTGTVLFDGSVNFRVDVVNNTYVGRKIPAPTGCDVTWCENTHKVSRTGWSESEFVSAVELSAARNEYEPLQLVLRPKEGLINARAVLSDFVKSGGAEPYTIASSNAEICLVEYVPVKVILEPIGAPGDYPDPVVPLTSSFSVQAGVNQPLWVTVFVPKAAPAGVYSATLTIISDSQDPVTVPINLRVFDFTLPDTTHTRTAYQFWLDAAWYKITDPAQRQYVWDLYMDNFRKHRVSPMIPQMYTDLKHRVVGDQIALDTREFDASMSRYLDEFGFNSFSFPKPPLTLGGYNRYTPEYQTLLAKLVTSTMEHLRRKGWDKKAYAFWYDEPFITGQYAKLITDMTLVGQAAPDLERLTTTHPENRLYGLVDTWVPMLDLYRWSFDDIKSRIQSGDQMWWYVACAPKHPFPNNFIDHPAINHRIRPWLAEKYLCAGEMYWCTMWYKGTNGVDRNPWLETMSGSNWGNGDGMLLYPPVRTHPTGAVLAGPINSLRWELVREGMEDSEYFWLLRQVIARALPRLGSGHPAILEGEAALKAITGLGRALDDYETSAQRLMVLRGRIASAIEALEDGSPMIITQPLSKTMESGSSVDFRVEALAWPAPEFQWFRNGVQITAATNSVLRLAKVNGNDAGRYSATVSNSAGFQESQEAVLTITALEQPRIIVEPQDLLVRLGGTATFAVGALGTEPVAYSWRFNGNTLNGVTTSSLKLNNAGIQHFGTYQVIVTNYVGSVTSRVATLARAPDPPVIISNPHSIQRYLGETAMLEVLAVGSQPLSYTWCFNGSVLPEALSNQLSFAAVAPEMYGLYQVSVSNVAGAVTGAPANIYPASHPLVGAQWRGSTGGPMLSVMTRQPTTILVSTNLINWSELMRVSPSDEAMALEDPDWTNSPARFYRAVMDNE